MVEQLKPCPFCDAKFNIVHDWATHPKTGCILDDFPLHDDEWDIWNIRIEETKSKLA